MKNIFTKKSFFIVCALAFVASVVTYWQSTTHNIVATVETPQTIVEEEKNDKTATHDLALNDEPTSENVAVPLPSKGTKGTTVARPLETLLESGKADMPAMNEEAREEAHEEAKRKSVQDRWKAEFDMIKNPATGQIPKGIHLKEVAAAKKARPLALPIETTEGQVSLRTLPTIDVTVRGPNNYGGRTRGIGFDKRDPQIVLAGGVSSGIYRSTNGGSSWTRVTPAGEIHSVTAFAQDPRAGQENTWYCGSGENNGNSAGSDYYGHGILKSTDNGVTWTPLANTRSSLQSFDTPFDYINRIVVSPDGVILVAASESIQRSTDGGATWTQVLGARDSGLPSDVIYNAAGNVFYAAIHGSNANGGVYRSATGAMGTWTQLRTPAQLQAGGVKRIVLSNVAATPKILAFYNTNSSVCAANSNAGLQLYDPAGNMGAGGWADHSTQIGDCAAGGSNPKVINFQDDYNMCITTKPDDADFVYLGGTEIYRLQLSNGTYNYIGGSQASANATNLHVDNHILLFEPGSNVKLWAGNDGGLRTTDVTGAIEPGTSGGYTWSDRTAGYITYQYYTADIHPTSGSNFVAGGAQDNAFSLQPATAEAKEVGPTVDGVGIGIISGTSFDDYSAIISWQNGAIARLTNGTETFIKPAGMANVQGFSTIFLLDGDNTSHLYYPTNTNKLFRTRNATAFTDTVGTTNAATGWEEIASVATALSGNGNIVSMAVTRNVGLGSAYTASNANRKMYMGTDLGQVFRFNDPAFGTTAPVNITPNNLTSGYVSSIAVNPYDDKEIMVTYSNYGVVSVWHTTDASVATPTWTNVEGATGSAVELASARSALIVRSGATNLYIVGTSTGLYGTTALSGATTVWERIGTNDIALSPSVSMRLRTSDNKAVLGTHGNGLFMLSFPSAVVPLDLLSFEAKKANTTAQINWVTANEVNVSHFNIQKSTDGKNFYFLNKVKASNAGNYQILDTKPNNGINYYRLEMVDLDGTKKVSKTVSVEFSTGKSVIKVYPTTTDGDLTIDNGTESIQRVTVYNLSGQLVLSTTNTNRINIADLPSGMYLVQVQSGGERVTEKVFKQ